MILRSFALIFLLVLAACGNTPSPSLEVTPEVTAESTAATGYNFALTARHETPLPWGGTASFGYPADWRVRDSSTSTARGEITIYGVDNYNISIAINNDPANTASTAEAVLNRVNQTATIETVEREGRTIYHSPTRGGNAWAATVYVDGTVYAYVEMVNTGRLALEPMYETAFAMLLSVEITAEE